MTLHDRNPHSSSPKPGYPELVEGPSWFLGLSARLRRKKQCFDKLSIDGIGGKARWRVQGATLDWSTP